MEVALIGTAVLFALLFAGVPIAVGMGVVGFLGFSYVVGFNASASLLGQVTYDTVSNYGLSVLPLFILMGNFVSHARLSEELYAASNAFIGHRRGGLAIATILACGGFAAVCGSSLATAATMSKIAMPSMRRFGYAESLATGSIAAGGTLGILIPPSVILIIYGQMTTTDVGKLFAAGILPGILGVFLYAFAVSGVTYFRPEMGPRGERTAWPERWARLRDVWGVVLLFVLVMGGIYAGVFTPTEAGGVGATGAFLFAALRRRLSMRGVVAVLVETTQTTAMIMFLLVGALMFSHFLDVAGAPRALVDWVNDLEVTPFTVIVALMFVFVVLGCFLESLAMILLTIPVLFPLIQDLGFDLIWFGIIVVVITEISLITPPIGINVFVLKSVMPEISLATIYRGVIPFILVDIVRMAILVAFPGFVLLLPNLMR